MTQPITLEEMLTHKRFSFRYLAQTVLASDGVVFYKRTHWKIIGFFERKNFRVPLLVLERNTHRRYGNYRIVDPCMETVFFETPESTERIERFKQKEKELDALAYTMSFNQELMAKEYEDEAATNS